MPRFVACSLSSLGAPVGRALRAVVTWGKGEREKRGVGVFGLFPSLGASGLCRGPLPLVALAGLRV